MMWISYMYGVSSQCHDKDFGQTRCTWCINERLRVRSVSGSGVIHRRGLYVAQDHCT